MKFLEWLGRIKYYIARAGGYMQIVNLILLTLVYFDTKNPKVIIIIGSIVVILAATLGSIDVHMGMLKGELVTSTKKNPIYMEILENTREIKDKMARKDID